MSGTINILHESHNMPTRLANVRVFLGRSAGGLEKRSLLEKLQVACIEGYFVTEVNRRKQ